MIEKLISGTRKCIRVDDEYTRIIQGVGGAGTTLLPEASLSISKLTNQLEEY